MSWMDSWSRPSKSQATPAPYYLLPGGESTPYCRSCGRVIGSRKVSASESRDMPVKYCSRRCASSRPHKRDRDIEKAFVLFMTGQEDVAKESERVGLAAEKGKAGKTKHKGDSRVLVSCDMVEKYIFGDRKQEIDDNSQPEDEHSDISFQETHPSLYNTDGSAKDIGDSAGNAAYVDGDVLARMAVRSGTRVRPPQSVSEVNGSVGGEKGRSERIIETEEMEEKRKQGQSRARQRETVRCAARRLVAFGVAVESDSGQMAMKKRGKEEKPQEPQIRKCEAVMGGKVVESSFAKGDWSIRWRE
ncbi:hypothetical protein G7046_g4038 [Stylonectria norvegica]|nr:hypothetical protein G7046_g4038 [Stylonectria norvegica]